MYGFGPSCCEGSQQQQTTLGRGGRKTHHDVTLSTVAGVVRYCTAEGGAVFSPGGRGLEGARNTRRKISDWGDNSTSTDLGSLGKGQEALCLVGNNSNPECSEPLLRVVIEVRLTRTRPLADFPPGHFIIHNPQPTQTDAPYFAPAAVPPPLRHVRELAQDGLHLKPPLPRAQSLQHGKATQHREARRADRTAAALRSLPWIGLG